MTTRIIEVGSVEINDKVLILKGEDFDQSFLQQLKNNLNKKGYSPAAVVLLPDYHEMLSASKKETISALKEIIKKLEESK